MRRNRKVRFVQVKPACTLRSGIAEGGIFYVRPAWQLKLNRNSKAEKPKNGRPKPVTLEPMMINELTVEVYSVSPDFGNTMLVACCSLLYFSNLPCWRDHIMICFTGSLVFWPVFECQRTCYSGY